MAFGPSALRKFQPPAVETGQGDLAPVESFIDQFCAPSAADPAADVPADKLAKAMERRRFVLAVHHHPLAAETAANLIAAKHWREYPILAVAGKRQTSALTYANYRNWLRKLGKTKAGRPNHDNLLALVDGYKPRKAEPIPAEFAQILCRLYLDRARRDVTVCHRMAKQIWRRAIRAESPPTYKRSLAFIRALEKAHPNAVLLAREGSDALKNQRGDHVDRDWSAYHPGQILMGDHRKLDFLCKIRDDQGNWRATRPWISAWSCPLSGYFVAVAICDGQPNGDVIERTLCDAIRHLGNQPPDYIYIDNGADYLRTGLVTPLEVEHNGQTVQHSIVKALGIQPVTALPYNARAKTIERCFREVSREFDRLMPGYLAHMHQWRDSATVNHLLKNPDALPTIAQVQQAIDYWLAEHYHPRPRPKSKICTLPPAQAIAERPPRPVLDDATLAQRFARPVVTRSVRRGGRVLLDGVTYQSPELWNVPADQKVLVCKTTWIDDRVTVRHLDGRHLCQAPRTKAIDAMQGDRKTLADKMRVGRLLERQAAKQIADLTGQTARERRADAAPIEKITDRVRLISSQPAPADPASPCGEPPHARQAPDAVPDPELDALTAELDKLYYPSQTQTPDDDDLDDLVAQLGDNPTA